MNVGRCDPYTHTSRTRVDLSMRLLLIPKPPFACFLKLGEVGATG